MIPQKPREIAARCLLGQERPHEYLETRLDAALTEAGLNGLDRRFAQELVFGVTRWRDTLDWLIAQQTAGRTQKPMLRVLLRLGLYQLFWMDRVPAHAAVHETVQLAKELGLGPQAGFLNAVLRSFERGREAVRRDLENLKREQPALGHSHPAWLWERWQARWGAAAAADLMTWNNQAPPVFARVNPLRIEPGKLLELWREEGVEYAFHTYDWTGENVVFELKSLPPLAGLASFLQGGFYIQDPSTLLAVHVLEPQPGQTILDRCAAPGGKTTYLAQLMCNQGRLVAQDAQSDRLRRLQENCQRLGVTNVELSRSDEVVFPELTCAFDRILVDVPCSNTGVMRRRVDLRWRIRPAELDRLPREQGEILHQAALQLKVGGLLVYSTCSLEPEENEQVIERFLAAHPTFEVQLQRQLTPAADRVDGAYVARLSRRG